MSGRGRRDVFLRLHQLFACHSSGALLVCLSVVRSATRPFCFCLRPSHGLAGAGARVSGSGGLSGRQSRRLGRVPAREGRKPAQEIRHLCGWVERSSFLPAPHHGGKGRRSVFGAWRGVVARWSCCLSLRPGKTRPTPALHDRGFRRSGPQAHESDGLPCNPGLVTRRQTDRPAVY